MNSAAFVFVTGLITTLAGVGGIEHAADLISPAVITATGLSITWVGTAMLGRVAKETE
jgi:hypothetical protein